MPSHYVGGVEDLEELLLQKARQDKTGIAGKENISPEKFQELIELALSQSEREMFTDTETGAVTPFGPTEREELRHLEPNSNERLLTFLQFLSGDPSAQDKWEKLFARKRAKEQDLVSNDIAPDTFSTGIRGGRKSGQNISRENLLKELGFE